MEEFQRENSKSDLHQEAEGKIFKRGNQNLEWRDDRVFCANLVGMMQGQYCFEAMNPCSKLNFLYVQGYFEGYSKYRICNLGIAFQVMSMNRYHAS